MILKKSVIICAVVIIFVSACIIGAFVFDRPSDMGESDGENTHTSPAKRLPTVVIDAGHGGEDGGASGEDGTLEKHLNLEISLMLAEMLRSRGFEVVMTRQTDILLYDPASDHVGHKKEQDMAKRLEIANSYDDAIFISIHMNSFPQAKYRGLQVYYSQNNARSEMLAHTLQDCVRTNLQPENTRKIKPSSGSIYLLEQLTMPAVLIECGFLSNPEECADLCDANYRQRLCMTLCTSIESFALEK